MPAVDLSHAYLATDEGAGVNFDMVGGGFYPDGTPHQYDGLGLRPFGYGIRGSLGCVVPPSKDMASWVAPGTWGSDGRPVTAGEMQDVVGFELITPSEARAYLEQVNGEYHSFNNVVLEGALAGKLQDANWTGGWGNQFFQWTAFYNEHHGDFNSFTHPAQIFQGTEVFQDKLQVFAAEYEQLTGEAIPGGAIVKPPTHDSDFGNLPLILGIGGAILVGGIVLAKVL